MRVAWDKRLKLMRISTYVIISIIIILLLFAAFTIYGNKVGNFVINVGRDSDVQLSLSDQPDLSKQTARLVYGSLTELTDSTYGWLPKDIASQGLGNLSDNKTGMYMAYSFYLINNSVRSVDCDMVLHLLDTVGDPMGMIRIMLIEDERGTFDSANHIYALEETSEERKAGLEYDLKTNHTFYNVEYFEDEETLFSFQIMDFEAGAYRKYTIVAWLEGCDLDTVNANIGARAKMQVDITGY